jgi:hypothetical protein
VTWRVGYEDGYYDVQSDEACPCAQAGLAECYCGGPVSMNDARDWLRERGIPAIELYGAEVITAIEGAYPGGWEAFYDNTAADKASRRLKALLAFRQAA